MIQVIAGLSLFPSESAPLFKTCAIFGAFLMGVVGLIAILQMTINALDQGPLLAGLSVYAAILFVKVQPHFNENFRQLTYSKLLGLEIRRMELDSFGDFRWTLLCPFPSDVLHHVFALLS